MSQCPVCRESLPNEHWRVFADHASCQKPAPPPAAEADRSEEMLRSVVEGAIATMSTSTEAAKSDE